MCISNVKHWKAYTKGLETILLDNQPFFLPGFISNEAYVARHKMCT